VVHDRAPPPPRRGRRLATCWLAGQGRRLDTGTEGREPPRYWRSGLWVVEVIVELALIAADVVLMVAEVALVAAEERLT
jgi:hypothetical protein